MRLFLLILRILFFFNIDVKILKKMHFYAEVRVKIKSAGLWSRCGLSRAFKHPF